MKASVGVNRSELSEPLNVGERVGIGPELGWESEQESNLCDTKTYREKTERKKSIKVISFERKEKKT
jgi:hypothetical protein